MTPHIALIVDTPVIMKPGTDLLTVAIGPQAFDDDEENTGRDEYHRDQNRSTEDGGTSSPPGCPVSIRTDRSVKFLAQVQKTDVTVYMADLIRFILTHFVEMDKLSDYMETLTGSKFTFRQLELIKVRCLSLLLFIFIPILILCTSYRLLLRKLQSTY